MGLVYESLTSYVRKMMIEEIDTDNREGILYMSKRLSPSGQSRWASLLKEAATIRDDNWLADQLRVPGVMNSQETRTNKSGSVSIAQIPITAPDTLAEGEFNRFYMRGVCRASLEKGSDTVTAYRGKAVQNPRPDSQQKVGSSYDAATLLADLRKSPGIDTALGLPSGPNSGLTVKLSS